ASSGLGRAMAKGLAEQGYHVFAGVRRASDGRELEAFHPGLQSVILDVTEEKTVTDVAEFLGEELGERGLGGLINNAGIAQVGPLEYLGQEQWHHQLDVNVLGAVAVTREMLPLVRRGSGRLIFVGSIGGRLAPPLLGPYVDVVTRSALRAMTAAKPRPRYVIGAEAHMVEFLTRMLPSRIKGPVVARVAGFPGRSTVSHRQR